MGKTSAAPSTTPHSFSGGDNSKPTNNPDANEIMFQTNLYFLTVLNMSWQLAVVVIVPIVAGFKADEYFGSTPWLAIVGLLVAAGASVVVVLNTVKRATIKAARGGKQ